MSHSQTLGAGDKLGTGDSYLTLDILPPELAAHAFDRLRDEVKWDVMHHRGGEVPRLVAVEGLVGDDGSIPIYRHPADESPPLHPFSPTVDEIRKAVEKVLQHPVNHVLIQLYRTGQDYISEHSDKTIDVVHGSYIVNVSLGAQRTMTLRMKRDGVPAAADSANPDTPPPPRTTQRIPLPHNSMFVMGLETNAKWMHGIKQDNRFITLKSPAEMFQAGERISLTFRRIGTFLSADQSLIWGQGATGKTRETARPVVHGVKESESLVIAFGAENHQSDFAWDEHYGMGFDVVNFKTKDDEEQQ
ncbi:DNA oxidative demethylase ALKBH2 [Mycena sanguinolenta]|uniref:DNA oxidative demethylase ALKBH2 n=1 Tax=Mycena sanguinolenta TaxID=230812 RepID=A0A8H6YQJ4_9AGAR|nr:DNA oxidative demethylase ALKBH2 [Mycena sanguinolenta]